MTWRPRGRNEFTVDGKKLITYGALVRWWATAAEVMVFYDIGVALDRFDSAFDRTLPQTWSPHDDLLQC